MKLKSLLAVLVLAAFAVSCDQDTPTMPLDDPMFAKGGIPGPPGGQSPGPGDGKEEPYEFVYDFTDDRDGTSSNALESDCVKKSPAETTEESDGYGKTFWCSKPSSMENPWFRLKVLDTSTNPPVPVTAGTVVWGRCQRIADDQPMDWTKCGVLQKPGKKAYHGVYFGEDNLPVDGVFKLELKDWVDGAYVWGMSWAFWDDEKPKPDMETKFKDLACVDYRNPYLGPYVSCPLAAP